MKTREQAAAACLDALDGALLKALSEPARVAILKQIVQLGRADVGTIAAKVMLLTTLSMLCLTELLPLWLLWVVLVRDGVILAGAEAYRRLTGGLDVRPTLSGKLAIALEFILVSMSG